MQIISSPTNLSVAVLMTCFNRVQKTLECLDVVFEQLSRDNLNLMVILVDDGSTDGTSDAVKTNFPQAKVLKGNGNLYWNRGMHLAFQSALEMRFDYYFWLNDDTNLHTGAIRRLLDIHQELTEAGDADSIVVGSTRDPVNGKFSYGGYRRRHSLFKLGLGLVQPSDNLEPCDTFCGNCVLIPRQVADKVGNIDPMYLHRWGDVDYGLRALEHQCHIWIAPGFLADCEDNPGADRWREPRLPLNKKIKQLHSIKGLGKYDWPVFVRRHGGKLWPLIWIQPYLRILYDTLKYAPKALISKLSGH